MGFFKNLGNSIKNAAGAVCDIVGSAGKGVATLVTDPQQFAEDVANNVKGWGQNIKEGWVNGWENFGEGAECIKEGGIAGLLPGVGKMVSGVMYGVTGGGLGAGEAIKDAFEDNTVVHRDEMGNIISIDIKDDAKGVGRFIADLGSDKGDIERMNRQEEWEEAIDNGEYGRATKIMGQHAVNVGGKVLAVTGVVAGVALAIPSGGSSLGLSAAGGMALGAGVGLAGTVAGMASKYAGVTFDKDNVADDVAKTIKSEVEGLMADGSLTEENRAEYETYLAQYLNSASYMATGVSDRETFDYVVDANHLLNKPDGSHVNPEELKATMDAFAETYAPLVDAGQLTQDQANRLSSLGANYALTGSMDDTTYYANMYMIQTENLVMNEEQRNAYVAHMVNYSLGEYDDAQLTQAIYSEPVLQDFVQADGTMFIPQAEETATLTASVSQQDYTGISAGAAQAAVTGAMATVSQPEAEDDGVEIASNEDIFAAMQETYGF